MILDDIAAATRVRIEALKKRAGEVRAAGENAEGRLEPFAFEKALKAPGLSVIAEIKKASPSRGVISETFPYLDIASAYERGGAAAISVLTEPKYFLGSNAVLSEVAGAVRLPVLRKDFILDGLQIYEAKALGADAVLLICALLSTDALRRCIAVADGLGLSCLVEAHDETETARAAEAGARVIGVNNRNLKDFSMDFTASRRLRALVPDSAVFVSESGVKTRVDMVALEAAGADAVLIGETLMRAADAAETLKSLRGMR